MVYFSHQWLDLVLVRVDSVFAIRSELIQFSITVPTRLMALKHGATLVWGPEMVDKAILHAEREVDRMYDLRLISIDQLIFFSCYWCHLVQRQDSRDVHDPSSRETILNIPNWFR